MFPGFLCATSTALTRKGDDDADTGQDEVESERAVARGVEEEGEYDDVGDQLRDTDRAEDGESAPPDPLCRACRDDRQRFVRAVRGLRRPEAQNSRMLTVALHKRLSRLMRTCIAGVRVGVGCWRCASPGSALAGGYAAGVCAASGCSAMMVGRPRAASGRASSGGELERAGLAAAPDMSWRVAGTVCTAGGDALMGAPRLYGANWEKADRRNARAATCAESAEYLNARP